MLQNKIKIEITKIFGEMLINPDKSLHRILYYVKNGDGDTRILIEDINFVKEYYNITVNDDIADAICIGHSNINTSFVQ